MVQEVKRMNYHNGLFLDENDFITDQNYNIQMRRLMNWYLNRMYGVLEGLDVVPAEGKKYKITPGIAISNSGKDKWYGTEIVLSSDQEVDFSGKDPGGYYVTIIYNEDKVDIDIDKGPLAIHWLEGPKINIDPVAGYSDSPEKVILAKITVPADNWVSEDRFVNKTDRKEIGPALRSINNIISIGTPSSPKQLEVNGKVNAIGTVKADKFIGDGSELKNAGKWNDVAGGGISFTGAGKVGIGTSSPSNKLHIDPQGPDGILIGNKTGSSTSLEIILSGATNGFSKFQSIKNVSQNQKGTISLNPDGGNVGINTTNPSQALEVNGVVQAASFIPPSDARLKSDIKPLTDVLDKLEKIRGVSFKWNILDPYGRSEGGREIGLIAQEVEEVFPELITICGDEGYRGIDYNRFTGVLLEAIKELKAENEAFKGKIKALEDAVSRNRDT